MVSCLVDCQVVTQTSISRVFSLYMFCCFLGYRGGSEESTESLFAETRHTALDDVVRQRILSGNYFLLRE